MPGAVPPAQTDENMRRYLLLLGAAGLLMAGLGLGMIFGLADYGQVQALGGIVYHENKLVTMPLAASPARFALLRGLLLLSGAAGLAGLLALRNRGALAALRMELRRAQSGLWQWQSRRSVSTRIYALVLLILVVVVRGWYLLRYPLSTDEIASYDFFVQHGPLAITSFYPIPNNHIFYNLLAWPLAETGLSPLLAMRLPGLLLGLAGTVAGYLLLARLAGERLALGLSGLVALAPLWAYYAVAGRGYFVQLCLLQVGFFAVAELLRPRPRYPRLAWLGFVASSVLGFYCIPTYAYPFLSLSLGLGGGLTLQRRGRAIGNLLVAGGVIGLVVLVLYSPVAAISGWERLIGNHYVVAKTPAQFWPTYRAFLYETAASLFGPILRVSGPIWLGLALGGGLLSHYIFRNASPPKRTAALLAWLLLALPLVLMAGQRVYAPTRMLLYVTFFGYLLVGLWLQQVPIWQRIPVRWQGLLLLLGVLAIGGSRLYDNQGQIAGLRQETQRIEAAYQWLRAQPMPAGHPPRVWMHAAFHELFFNHYELQEHSNRRLRLVTQRSTTPAQGYEYLVIGNRPEDRALPRPTAPYRARYRDALVTIYALQAR